MTNPPQHLEIGLREINDHVAAAVHELLSVATGLALLDSYTAGLKA
jgi:hypothetical protein